MFIFSAGSGMNVFVVVSTWLQHRVLMPDKHGVHFPVLEGNIKFNFAIFDTCTCDYFF